MLELTMVVPSRGRPESIRELSQAFRATCTAQTFLVVAVDEDDPTLDAYRQVQADEGHSFNLVVGPRLRIGGTLNVVVPREAELAQNVGFMGDDHRPRTEGWDTKYIESLRSMGTGVVYGNDLLQGRNLPTQVAMTSNIVLATGHFVPDGMLHLYLDNAWLTLGRHLAIEYLPNVIVEHMHPTAGKGEWDEGYAENNANEVYEADGIAFENWKQNILPDWLLMIREFNNG